MGKMFCNCRATFSEFEADLIRMRTRDGMAFARAKGRLRRQQQNSPIAHHATCVKCKQ
jgi:DNA invertase Pin-like site-specific DNA recombinase